MTAKFGATEEQLAKPESVTARRQAFRCEGMRAAAQTMHGAVEVQGVDKISIIKETIDIAEAFADWLEHGRTVLGGSVSPPPVNAEGP